MARTHYEWLEIAENASPEVVRGAFKYLVQRWHPDKNPDNPGLARLILREINEAFEVLSNPDARRKYDLWLKISASIAQTSTAVARIMGARHINGHRQAHQGKAGEAAR
jgi:curved DNA-binding protein CbpA